MQEVITNISINQIIIDVAITVIVSSGISYFLIKYLSDRIADRLKIGWESAEKIKFLDHQKSIDRDQTLYKGILDSYSSTNQLSQSIRINAVQKIWKNVVDVREQFNVTFFVYDMFKIDRINNIFNLAGILKYVNENLTDDFIGSSTYKNFQTIREIEEYRPFINEKLWFLYINYVTFLGYVSVNLREGIKRNNIIYWYNDDYNKSVLDTVFSKEEKESILSREQGSLRKAIELWESKILNEFSGIISGKLSTEKSIDEIKKLEQLVLNRDMMVSINNNIKK